MSHNEHSTNAVKTKVRYTFEYHFIDHTKRTITRLFHYSGLEPFQEVKVGEKIFLSFPEDNSQPSKNRKCIVIDVVKATHYKSALAPESCLFMTQVYLFEVLEGYGDFEFVNLVQ